MVKLILCLIKNDAILISALDDRLSASCPHSFIFVKQGEKYVWLGTAANLDSVPKKEVCHSGGIEPQMSQ